MSVKSLIVAIAMGLSALTLSACVSDGGTYYGGTSGYYSSTYFDRGGYGRYHRHGRWDGRGRHSHGHRGEWRGRNRDGDRGRSGWSRGRSGGGREFVPSGGSHESRSRH